jgi:peptidoglycan hydrolase-like protein with peptidoglycan-binding domain
MNYPGRVIREGNSDKTIVRAIQAQLDARGCGPLDKIGVFGQKTKASIKLFQARNVDSEGNPLKQDGKVGPLTWGALFGDETIPAATGPASEFLTAVLAKAASQVGVLEQPRNSNSGPQVDEYLRRTGVPLGLPAKEKPWCCAFVYWCFDETASEDGRANPMMPTAGCLDHWNGAASYGARRITASKAANDPALLAAGMIFIIDHGGGRGHTGFVEQVAAGFLHTIEGNTDASLTREGGGVYRLKRKLGDINKGFIDYGHL